MAKETEFEHPPKGHTAALGYEDSSDNFIAFAVNADGRLEVVIPYEEALGARAYHYDGSTWRKSNLIPGYNDRWYEAFGGAATATSMTYSTDTVPEGYVYWLKCLQVRNRSGSRGNAELQASTGGANQIILGYESGLTVHVPVLWNGELPLKEDDLARIFISSINVGDNIECRAWGYKMKIDM